MRRTAGSAATRQLGRAAAIAGVVSIFGSCGGELGAPRPGTQQGEEIIDLWRVLFWAAIAVGALVYGLIGWALFRYRARGRSDFPTQTRGSIPLEIAWTVAPLVLAGVLFALSVQTEAEVEPVSDEPDLTIEVTGFQWQWRFVYPEEKVTVLGGPEGRPELVLPVDRVIRLELHAADVIHSFFVPGFIGKKDLIPGLENELELRPVKTGRYLGHCTEFCGVRHAYMNFDVRVVPEAEFRRWAAAHKERDDGAA